MFEEPGAHAVPGDRSVASLLTRAGLTGVSRGVLAGAAVLCLLALALVGWRLSGLGAADDAGLVFEAGAAGGEAGAAEPATGADAAVDAPPETLWVHVAGAVASPGLRELPGGARVGEAVAAAGGALPGAALDAVNLARLLTDGEQVYVPTAEEVAAGGGLPAAAGVAGAPGTGAGQGAAGGVDINTAGAAELEQLPGVGPATAAKIVADREANGPFTAPEDIMRVSGIGEKKFESMRDLIVVR